MPRIFSKSPKWSGSVFRWKDTLAWKSLRWLVFQKRGSGKQRANSFVRTCHLSPLLFSLLNISEGRFSRCSLLNTDNGSCNIVITLTHALLCFVLIAWWCRWFSPSVKESSATNRSQCPTDIEQDSTSATICTSDQQYHYHRWEKQEEFLACVSRYPRSEETIDFGFRRLQDVAAKNNLVRWVFSLYELLIIFRSSRSTNLSSVDKS